MGIQNSHAGPSTGCVRLGSTKSGVIRDCGFNGFIGITTEDAVGQSSASIHIENSAFGGPGTTGSHYIIIGGGGAIQGCNMPGADVAVRAYGEGLHIAGNRSERCNTSFLLGLDSGNNNVGLRGFSLLSTSTEGCWTAYDLAGLCEGFVMAGIGSNSHGSDNSGTVPFIQGGQYGIRIRADCARGGVIQSAGLSGAYDVGAFVIANATARGNLVIRECSAAQSGGIGTTWIFPSNAYTALFYNNNEDPAWTYSQLPSGGNVFEGDEFNITDSNTATWGATAAGSGSNNVLVRWNGSVWTVVGK
jgi:hypothetical protein